MARTPYNAYKTLYERIATINGSTDGYYHSISASRVLSYLRVPGESGSPELPYICLPLDDDGDIGHVQGGAVKTQINVPIYVFLPGDLREGVLSGPVVESLRWLEDLLHCLMPTSDEKPWWNFGESGILDVEILSKEIIAGIPESPISWLRVDVGLHVMLSRADVTSGD